MYYVTCVFDKKAEAFMVPQFYVGLGQASRNFQLQVRDRRPENLLSQAPEDFTLFFVALFDEATGMFSPPSDGPDAGPVAIMHGLEAAKVKE